MSTVKWLTEKTASHTDLTDEQKKVVEYGLGALRQWLFLMVCSAVFGFLFRCHAEAMVIFWTVGLLKSAAGGAHASLSFSCNVISLLSIFLMSLSARYGICAVGEWRWLYLAQLAAVLLIVFLLAFRYAPVDHPNKPIRPEKRRKLRLRTFVMLGGVFLIGCALVWFCGDRPRLLNVTAAICFASLWQGFMLTPAAKRFIQWFEGCLCANTKKEV